MKKSTKTLATCAVLLLSVSGLYIYKTRFSPETAPAQLEYLTNTAKPKINLISVANAGEVSAAAKQTKNGQILFDFSEETVGATPKTFTPAVGNWIIGNDNNNTVLVVDGRKWKRGVASAGIADKAKALYGERYAEFLDNVTAYAYFPFAVANNVNNFENGEITVRFKGVAGRIDQGAGILFDLKANGDYYAIRANPLEHNLVLWRYKHGNRSSISWVRNVKTPSHKWHDLKLSVKGNLIKGSVNGKLYLTHRLPDSVSGKVGLWTKADSVIYFDDYKITSH